MSRYAEIKARHDNDREMMQRLLTHGHFSADVTLHFDRAALLKLVARLVPYVKHARLCVCDNDWENCACGLDENLSNADIDALIEETCT